MDEKPPLTHVSQEDITLYDRAVGDLSRAQEGAQRAMQQARAAQEGVAFAQGAVLFLERQFRERYDLREGDDYDPRTGEITRAPRPVPEPEHSPGEDVDAHMRAEGRA